MKKQSDTDLEKNNDLPEGAENEDENVYHLKTKTIPSIVMLLGGAAASITAYVYKYTLKETTIILLISLIVFLIIGCLLKHLFDSFKIVIPDETEEEREGEVIEKDAVTEDSIKEK